MFYVGKEIGVEVGGLLKILKGYSFLEEEEFVSMNVKIFGFVKNC